jgi:hypothetical protein
MDEARDARQRELARRVNAAVFAMVLAEIVTESRVRIGLGTDSAIMGRMAAGWRGIPSSAYISSGRGPGRSMFEHKAERVISGRYKTGD